MLEALAHSPPVGRGCAYYPATLNTQLLKERRREKMTEIIEFVREKLDWGAERIREFFTGSNGYKLGEEKVWLPDVGKVVDARHIQRFPPADSPCDRY
jgi:hypothetical protein